MTLDEIEAAIACGEMTAMQAFTRLKRLCNPNEWASGEYSVKWLDEDYLLITSAHGHQCKITGGDFEYFLDAMTSCEQII